jgi:hypothetical protein
MAIDGLQGALRVSRRHHPPLPSTFVLTVTPACASNARRLLRAPHLVLGDDEAVVDRQREERPGPGAGSPGWKAHPNGNVR